MQAAAAAEAHAAARSKHGAARSRKRTRDWDVVQPLSGALSQTQLHETGQHAHGKTEINSSRSVSPQGDSDDEERAAACFNAGPSDEIVPADGTWLVQQLSCILGRNAHSHRLAAGLAAACNISLDSLPAAGRLLADEGIFVLQHRLRLGLPCTASCNILTATCPARRHHHKGSVTRQTNHTDRLAKSWHKLLHAFALSRRHDDEQSMKSHAADWLSCLQGASCR